MICFDYFLKKRSHGFFGIEPEKILIKQTEDKQDDLLISLVALWFLRYPTLLIYWDNSPWDTEMFTAGYALIMTYVEKSLELFYLGN